MSKPAVKTRETKRGIEITTPKARAGFSALTVPSTKFKEGGEYSIAILMPADAPETQELIAILDEQMKVSEEKAKTETKKKKVKLAAPPYKAEEDEDGEETGNIKFNFKLPAKYEITDDSGKVVDTIHYRPVLYDAKGHKLPASVRVGGGSLVKVFAEASPFYTDGFGAGVKLRLKAVQIIELVAPNGNVSFSGSGFEEEEGYDFKDGDTAFDDADESTNSEAAGDAGAESDF